MLKKIYVLDHKIRWSVFKKLHDKMVKDSGPTPVHGDKMIWELLRDKKIYCWYDPKLKNDMRIGTSLPKNKEYQLITNPKK
uniref:Uncharacterized protein n=1 Tax=viral metagenome TaxID=1070528 RepID=A0A6H1ZKH6_9ZZZZ